MRLNKLQQAAVAALEDIKARDITLLDVRKRTSLYDSLIVASAESARQVKALARNVRDKLKAAGADIVGVEGEEAGEWVLVDAGSIVVHVMQPSVRAHYNLEELWTPPAPRRRAAAPAAGAGEAATTTATGAAPQRTAATSTPPAAAAAKPAAAKRATAGSTAPAAKTVPAKRATRTPAAAGTPAAPKAAAARPAAAPTRRRRASTKA